MRGAGGGKHEVSKRRRLRRQDFVSYTQIRCTILGWSAPALINVIRFGTQIH
jgi:hypothetical protein